MFFTKSQTPHWQNVLKAQLQDSDENFSDCDEYDDVITFDKFGHIDESHSSIGVAFTDDLQTA